MTRDKLRRSIFNAKRAEVWLKNGNHVYGTVLCHDRDFAWVSIGVMRNVFVKLPARLISEVYTPNR